LGPHAIRKKCPLLIFVNVAFPSPLLEGRKVYQLLESVLDTLRIGHGKASDKLRDSNCELLVSEKAAAPI
jgi:hypothetical protein